MALAGNTFVTLLDNNKTEHNGKALILGTEVYQINEFLQDLMFDSANDGLAYVSGIITSTGTSSYARFNQGSPSTKISIVNQVDKVEILRRKVTIDLLTSMTMQDKDAKIQQWNEAHREGLSVDMTYDFLYGNPAVNLDQMIGYSLKMGSSSIPTVFKAASSGSALTSIEILTHSVRDLVGFYPQPGDGSLGQASWNSGINYMVDVEYVNSPSNDGTQYKAEVHTFLWGLGFAIKNHRTQARACNIPTGYLSSSVWNTTSPTTSNTFEIYDICMNTLNQMQNIRAGNRVIYMNRVIWNYLTRQTYHKSQQLLTPVEIEGYKNPLPAIMNSPIRFVEQISNNETVVV